MDDRGKNTFQEINSQPEVWADAINVYKAESKIVGDLWAENQPDQVIFIGCGSTYYLARTASALFKYMTGVPAFAYPASELALTPKVVIPDSQKVLLVAISRSGETTETSEAISLYQKRTAGKVVAITCDSQSTIAKQADVCLGIDTAKEKSIAQTRSFTSMLILAQSFVGDIANQELNDMEKLPIVAGRLLSEYHLLAKKFGERQQIKKFFFLGSGLLNGLANEAMLKMKEMSLSYSEAFHILEFRHGPMSMIDESSLVVGFISEHATAQEAAVLKDMHNLGAKILSLSEAPIPELVPIAESIILNTSLPEWMRPVTYLPVLQLLAYYRSMTNGLNPDRPTNLDAVVKLTLENLN